MYLVMRMVILFKSTLCPNIFMKRETWRHVELFDWSEKTQGLIFGSLYWSYMPLQTPMGVAVERLGVRYLLGGGMLLASLCYLLTPIAVINYGAVGFIVTRVIMGVGLAPAYPSLNVILAKWAPPKEKSKLAAIIYAGENLGFIFSMAMSGLILGSAKGNWPVLFYVYGAVSVAWLILWAFFGYDDPATHPFISAEERVYLEDCMPHNVTKEELPPTPWLDMAKSLPLWGVLIAQIGHDWGIITIVTELPRYMKQVLHYEIEANGLLNAIPYVAMTVVAVVSGWVSDWILHKNIMSITTVRKVFNSISAAGPALGIVAAMHAGCDSTMVVLMFTLGMALMGFFYSSLAVNTLDLSPNYSGTLMGILAFGGLGGIISPYLAGIMAPEARDL
ncbi:hypothetical protein J6590_067873 [Homalodisca vitripennis]|nr:hypothetical protein J6590_067873 [Homalodisca vitripennis]